MFGMNWALATTIIVARCFMAARLVKQVPPVERVNNNGRTSQKAWVYNLVVDSADFGHNDESKPRNDYSRKSLEYEIACDS